MFGDRGACVAVVGTQWGDEGKGKIVDVLAHQSDVVIRYQGGANAGHTVVVDQQQIILHQIPSGILHPSTTCLIGNGVVLDPETLRQEIAELTDLGFEVRGRLFLSERCHLVLPFHKALDRVTEGRQKIGTTGRGIGPSYEAKSGRRGIRVADLRSPDRLETLVRDQLENANRWMQLIGVDQRATLDEQLAVLDPVDDILSLARDTGEMAHQAIQGGQKVLLEGAQGTMLDVDHGTYPFVTSSNTVSGGATIGAGIGPTCITSILGVTKAYATRVGNGPLPTELGPDESEKLRQLGGEFGATTGRPRRCGWLDLVVLRYAARINGLTHLAITKLDVLDSLQEIPVCLSYHRDGDPVGLPPDPESLSRVEPQYRVLEGWNQPLGDTRSYHDLPAAARAYLEFIEQEVGVAVKYVSVGTRRDQIIARD